MKRQLVVYLSLTVLIGLTPRIGHAASAFKTSTGLGAGEVTIAGTCADISCAGGHSCFCAEGTDIPFKATGGIGSGTVHIEMLMDNSNQIANLSGLICDSAGGVAFFTTSNGKSTLTFGLAGTYCETNPGNSSWAGVTGIYTINSGGGSFANAGGSGVFSFGGLGLDAFGTFPAQLQTNGNFNKTAPTSIRSTEGNASSSKPSDIP